jgi:iron complex outermembrane receptor protein
MKTLSKLLGLILSMSILPFAAASAQQGGVSAIDEVVVTARKRAESLQDVPIAITAFTEETIERAGIERP